MPTKEEVLEKIGPVKVKHLPAFLTACEPVATACMAGDFAKAIVENADNVIQAVALGAGIDREWLDDQGADVLVELAAKVVEVNIDFFVRTLLPKIAAAADAIDAKIPAGGMDGSAV
ncbi:MAG: hypothetical protein AB7D27_11645 [Desulfomicrobium sp.]